MGFSMPTTEYGPFCTSTNYTGRARSFEARPRRYGLNSSENKFDRIYREQIWSGKDDGIPLSGPGSQVESSLPVIDFINHAVEQEKISSVLDLGCGDLTYISTVDHITSGKVSYTGTDISDFILRENSKKYPWFNGVSMDITEPRKFEADLIIIKDLLFHLTNEQIESLFENLTNSRFRFCLVTTMKNISNRGRTLDPRHNYADVNIRVAPFFRNRYLHTIARPRSANTSKRKSGEFLVYDMESFRTSDRGVARIYFQFAAAYDRLWRNKR